MLGPQNTSSSSVTLSYTETLFWILTLLPMRTRLPTNTFCPSEQSRPMTAPAHTCTQCHTRVPSPSCAPGSMMAVGCTCSGKSVFQRQRDAAPIARREVTGNQQLERPQPLAAVGLRLGFTAHY